MPLRPRRRSARLQVNDDFGLSFAKIGATRFDLGDPYHAALTMRWPAFTAAVFGLYGAITAVFALLYWLAPGSVAGAHPGFFWDDLFFSIETLATVGYGEMAPATVYGHTLAALEIISGMGFTAIMTGLIFVRFSRPRAKILYADKAVVTRHNGVPTLMIRIANGRMGTLMNTAAELSALIAETSDEGRVIRRSQPLELRPSHWPMFPMMLTLTHVIDAKSPLRGFTADGLREHQVRFFLNVEAHDPALAATVRDAKIYRADDLVFGAHYGDAINVDGERILADLTRISVIEADQPAG